MITLLEFEQLIKAKYKNSTFAGEISFRVFISPLPLYFAIIDKKVIYVDRCEMFDKWMKCPIQVKLPQTQEEVNQLFNAIDLLLTDEGLEKSNEFEIILSKYGE